MTSPGEYRQMPKQVRTEGEEKRADDSIVRFIWTLDEMGKHTIKQKKAQKSTIKQHKQNKQNKAEIGKFCIFLGFCLHICKKSSIFAAEFA